MYSISNTNVMHKQDPKYKISITLTFIYKYKLRAGQERYTFTIANIQVQKYKYKCSVEAQGEERELPGHTVTSGSVTVNSLLTNTCTPYHKYFHTLQTNKR